MEKEQELQQKQFQEYESYKQMNNLSFLVDDLKQQNKDKQEFFLPEKYGADLDKLTVCVELDDVFLHVFFPDEFEGYLMKPERDDDWSFDLPEFNTFLHIYKRFHMETFLNYIQNETEGVIFATGSKVYVDKVMDLIDKDRKIFKHRLYQEHCNHIVYAEEGLNDYSKDLDNLGRDMRSTVLIDCKPLSFWPNPDNCIPTLEYQGNSKEDRNLLELVDILEELKANDNKDVRTVLKEKFGIRQHLKESNLL